MTETQITAPTLFPVTQKFVLHWGEMGTRWGVNRTVAQIHALLYISPKPLSAEQIALALSVARSNVSTSLRELHSWRLIRTVHVLGDRRDYFETYQDVWELFKIVIEERKLREIDPTRRLVDECIADLEKGDAADPFARKRLEELAGFMEITMRWFDEVRRFSPMTWRKIMQLGGRVQKLLGLGG